MQRLNNERTYKKTHERLTQLTLFKCFFPCGQCLLFSIQTLSTRQKVTIFVYLNEEGELFFLSAFVISDKE